MKRSIRTRIFLGTATGLVLLGIIGALILRTTTRLIEDNRWVAHAYDTLMTLERARSAIVEAETAQRGYLITRQEVFLESGRVAMVQVDQRLHELLALTSDNPAEQRRIATLREKLEESSAIMKKAIALRTTGGPRNVLREMVGGEGRITMDEIRRLLMEMGMEERRLLARRVEESESSTRLALLAFATLFLLILGLFGSIYYLVKRDLNRRSLEEEAIRESRERFELAVRGSRDGLWDWDLPTDEVYFSPRWKSMLGYEDHEIRSEFKEWESRLHPDDRDRALATVAEYQQGKLPEYELEHRLRHKDGSYRWILARGVALRDPDGKPYRMAGSHTDITARKEAERQLAQQNRMLEEAARSEREALDRLKQTQAYLVQSEKLASLGQLVAGVAHEINNPLAFVINNVAVLKRDVAHFPQLIGLYQQCEAAMAERRPDLVEPIRSLSSRIDLEYTLCNLTGMIERTSDGLGRIRQIVTDLRNFARLDEGGTKESDINAGIASTVHIILGQARQNDVDLEMDLTPLPLVLCNPTQVNQVVLNVVANAIDACPRGGMVTIRTRAADGVEIHILDTGHGIDPTIRHKIFDPFFTTKPVGQGTGLGLSISYGIVADHGGRIDVESSPGAGSHFIIYLPLRSAPVVKRSLPTPDGQSRGTDRPGS